MEQVEREEHDEARDHDADQVADLHLPRRAAEDVADLQVLQHLAGDGGRDADDRGHAEHRGDALVPLTPTITIVSAATIMVASVRPEIGLFDEPIMPTRLPETAAKKKPVDEHHDRREERARQRPS